MFRSIKLAAAWRQIERGGALHIYVKPIAGRLDLAKDNNLGRGIILDGEMITLAQVAALTHFLRNNDLASAGHSCCH